MFETLQDRLVKEMRLAGIDSLAAANHFLETRFIPQWEQRFSVTPRTPRNAHRRLDGLRLKEILSVRVGRQVADDHTVSWDGHRWGVQADHSIGHTLLWLGFDRVQPNRSLLLGKDCRINVLDGVASTG